MLSYKMDMSKIWIKMNVFIQCHAIENVGHFVQTRIY